MLRFIESFDHISAATTTPKWDAAPLLNAVTKRTGIQSARTSTALNKTLDSQATWVIGFAWYTTGWVARDILRLLDTATIHVTLAMNAAGALIVTRNGTQLAISPNAAVSINTWHWIEAKFTIADAPNGSWQVKVDGVDAIVAGTGDTRNGGNASANKINFYDAVAYDGYVDDVVMQDGQDGTATQGAPFNDFLGDCLVRCGVVTGDGANQQFTPLGGGTHFSEVDEIPPDEDTSYNSDAVAGHKDTYTHAASGVTGTPLAVQVCSRVKKDDAGLRTARSIIKSGASYGNGVTRATAAGYETWSDIFALDPDTGLPWSKAAIDASEIGLEVIA